MNKKFLTYNQQMKYLRETKKIKCSGTEHKKILASCGYFNLVNGYKNPFSVGRDSNGNRCYMANTTLDEIYALKLFDDDLRLLLFKCITKIENEVRALCAYAFDNSNRNNSYSWYNVAAYDSVHSMTDIVRTISKIYSELSRSRHAYVRNYMENHKEIPIWVLIKVISFSNAIDFVYFTTNEIKDNLCEVYNIKKEDESNNYKLLMGSLQWLRRIRNSCAHNERVYDMCLRNQRMHMHYFDTMGPTYNNNNNKDKLLIDAIVYFKYYLSETDFKSFIIEFQKLLSNLEGKLNAEVFQRVRASMGIKDVKDIQKLLFEPKEINYKGNY